VDESRGEGDELHAGDTALPAAGSEE
jgi:hypothetical protein